MRLLLDTHLVLRALAEPDRLKPSLRDAIESAQNQVLFSTASIWEIAIKSGLGRPDFSVRPEEVATEALARGFDELLIGWRAAAAVADLPLHHRDPFDRIIVAQAMTEPIHLYTVDPKLRPYTDLVRLV
ncbi:MAG TPA: type II toxin-antitoxin system VapC family toxin [Acetobacteraceae bacterium]|jgi:PIN domain nuclease of toxin-antitoxin system|nr:type II toxin-antitoxin system VapC family toxin [Acetobacteraceae bacterium]